VNLTETPPNPPNETETIPTEISIPSISGGINKFVRWFGTLMTKEGKEEAAFKEVKQEFHLAEEEFRLAEDKFRLAKERFRRVKEERDLGHKVFTEHQEKFYEAIRCDPSIWGKKANDTDNDNTQDPDAIAGIDSRFKHV
jgi:hypothetical protein